MHDYSICIIRYILCPFQSMNNIHKCIGSCNNHCIIKIIKFNLKTWYTSGTLRQSQSLKTQYLQGFPGFSILFKLANKSLPLYISV